MSSYHSLFFLFGFLPFSFCLYQITPKSKRWISLLFLDCLLFYLISGKLIVFIIASALIMYYMGLKMDSLQNEFDTKKKTLERAERKALKQQIQKRKARFLTMGAVLHIGTLLVLKYTAFFFSNLQVLFNSMNVAVSLPIPTFVLPIGISFYSFQAISYMADVYRGTIKADHNFFRLFLFLSFFPCLMEGPICRYSQTAEKLWEGNSITYANFTFGLQRIGWGVMKKRVISDRINPLVQELYTNFNSYNGFMMFVAAIAYTIQLYCEFSGTIDIVIGVGQVFGITLPENFKQPFFSQSISEFWTRWHITLGTWFKDYVFYPISMSKFMKKLTLSARKKIDRYYGPVLVGGIALFAVWLSNGLWHGVGWNYIFFGMYHFVLILGASLITPTSQKLTEKLKINREGKPYRYFRIIRTSLLVIIGEMFFNAHGLSSGLVMFKKLITQFSFAPLFDGTLMNMGLDIQDYLIVGITLVIIFAVSLLKERGVRIREEIAKKPIPVRWAFYYGLILFVIIFGAYGVGYIPMDPVYANF